MKRLLVAGLLLACGCTAGCVAAIVGGGGSSTDTHCQERGQRNCEHK